MKVCIDCGLEHADECKPNDLLGNEEIVFLKGGPLAGTNYPSRPKGLPRVLMTGPPSNGRQMVLHYSKTQGMHGEWPVFEFRSHFSRRVTDGPTMNEDLWLAEIDGEYAAEVGAWDGLADSPTWELEKRGWKVLCVEPNPGLEATLKQNRRLVAMYACGENDSENQPFHVYHNNSASYSSLNPVTKSQMWQPTPGAKWSIEMVGVRRLTRLLEEAGFPRIDALSVDTEGTELDVLKGLDFDKYRPKRIVCEAWEDGLPIESHLADKGYRLVERRDVNLLFSLK